MEYALTIFLIALAVAGTATFGTVNYSLRLFSRVRVEDLLDRRKKSHLVEPLVEHTGELAFLTAAVRLFMNLLVLIGILHLVRQLQLGEGWEYLLAVFVTIILALVASVAGPHVIASRFSSTVVAAFAGPLVAMHHTFRPLTRLLNFAESMVDRATSRPQNEEQVKEKNEEEFESELMAAVEEGEKEGVVDETEREMIESVITFRTRSVAQVMTARPDIMGLPMQVDLQRIRAHIEESGHSRIPIYEQSLDHIVGVLYARDLIKFVGETPGNFDIHDVMRPPFFVPESKLLRDLLSDFRLQKVHIAIVLDEYGGTAGLVTIEDILEELVGEISDEHEGVEPAIFHRIDDNTADVDAKIHVDELNRLLGTHLSEDADYDTLAGFVMTHLGKIPTTGTEFEHDNVAYFIADAETQRVNRIRVKILPPTVVAEE